MIWHGNPYMIGRLVDINSLVPDESQYKDKPTLLNDLKTNGQQSALIVDGNRIKDGNNRYQYLKQLGFTHISVRD